MPHWHVFSQDHQVPGQILIDLAHAIGSDEIMPYYKKHGLTNIDPKAWYPQQTLLDIYNEMEDSESGSMFDFVSIGMKEAQQAIVPDHFKSLPLLSILQGVGAVFKLNNRGTDIGEIKCETVTDTHVKIILRVPAPDDLWYGIFYGFVQRFIPKGTHFTVYFDKDIPRRDQGGAVTIIHITWG
jgi:hypothetical protein